MLNVIRMPQMGVSDESAILSKWLVCEGDRIRRGQPVFSLETDKATFQYEAESDGFLVRILTGEGEEAAVGNPVGVLSDTAPFDESELQTLLRGRKTPFEETQIQIEAKSDIPRGDHTIFGTAVIPALNLPEGKRKVSPRARKMANELGVNLKYVYSGSGPEGRIIERDIREAIQKSLADSKSELKSTGIRAGRPLTVDDRVHIRSICAEGAGRTGFVSRQVDARRILAVCMSRAKLTPGAMVCHELARLLVRTPELNARRHGDRIYEYGTVHLRLTVETRSGTLKPVIRCTEAYPLHELAVLMRNAAGRCGRFASKPQEFQEGTFTVADLSGYGVDSFTPELTPPELCALGIGAASVLTRLNEQGGVEEYPAIRLTLAYDRAGVDAIRAAEFLNELAIRLERGVEKQ